MKQSAAESALELEMSWGPVYAAVGEPYRFPQKTTKYLRRTYDVPGVYCWRVVEPRVEQAVYIGETDCLTRRLRGYLSPGNARQTNRRLWDLFAVLVKGKAEITFEVLHFAPFRVNGYEVTMEKLGNPHVRRLLESMAIVTETRMGSLVLNLGKDIVDRQKPKLWPAVQQMEPEERARFLKFLAKKKAALQ